MRARIDWEDGRQPIQPTYHLVAGRDLREGCRIRSTLLYLLGKLGAPRRVSLVFHSRRRSVAESLGQGERSNATGGGIKVVSNTQKITESSARKIGPSFSLKTQQQARVHLTGK